MHKTKKRNLIILTILVIIIAAVCVLTFAKFLPHANYWLIVGEEEGAMRNDSIITETNLTEYPILQELIGDMQHGSIGVPITDEPWVMRHHPRTISTEIGEEIIEKFGKGNRYILYDGKYYQIRWSES